jgi:hypothetical protein
MLFTKKEDFLQKDYRKFTNRRKVFQKKKGRDFLSRGPGGHPILTFSILSSEKVLIWRGPFSLFGTP